MVSRLVFTNWLCSSDSWFYWKRIVLTRDSGNGSMQPLLISTEFDETVSRSNRTNMFNLATTWHNLFWCAPREDTDLRTIQRSLICVFVRPHLVQNSQFIHADSEVSVPADHHVGTYTIAYYGSNVSWTSPQILQERAFCFQVQREWIDRVDTHTHT